MKHILVLLSSAVLLCSAAPAFEMVTCNENSHAAAARLAVHHINAHHDHGYKFRLSKTQHIKVVTVDGGCDVELGLKLLETKCHVVNPKHFEDCEIREEHERAVMADCTVKITVKMGHAKVTKYECKTQQVKTDMEMMVMCPGCPQLIALDSLEGARSVDEIVKKVNQNTTNHHYYIMQEMGRVESAYLMSLGMMYFAEVLLVETRCPMGSRIAIKACEPLCPDRARHALCHSSYSTTMGFEPIQCEFYPPSNVAALAPGKDEPVCSPPAGQEREHHGAHATPHSCHSSNVVNHVDPALHPICPWPHPKHRPKPHVPLASS